MSDDWLCIDHDSVELEEYIAGETADAVAKAGQMLDEIGVGADERQVTLAKVATMIEERWRSSIARARANATRGTTLQ